MDNEQISRIIKVVAVLLLLIALWVVVYFVFGFFREIPDEWDARTPQVFDL
jgi:uncharacterized membrane-anchored protein